MGTRQMSYRQWMSEIAPAVPLNLVHRVLNLQPEEVAHDASTGKLPVQTFRAGDGRVFQMVRLQDAMTYRRSPLTIKGMARAVEAMINEDAPSRRAA